MSFYGFCTPIPSVNGPGIQGLMETQQTFVLQVSATWCGHCATAAPQIQAVSCLMPHIPFYRADADEDLGPVSIEALPSTVVFLNGVEANRLEGAYSAEQYTEWISAVLDGLDPPDLEDEDEDEGEDEDEDE
jgi:thiol-disulfide isomerase/thioredoxin